MDFRWLDLDSGPQEIRELLTVSMTHESVCNKGTNGEISSHLAPDLSKFVKLLTVSITYVNSEFEMIGEKDPKWGSDHKLDPFYGHLVSDLRRRTLRLRPRKVKTGNRSELKRSTLARTPFGYGRIPHNTSKCKFLTVSTTGSDGTHAIQNTRILSNQFSTTSKTKSHEITRWFTIACIAWLLDNRVVIKKRRQKYWWKTTSRQQFIPKIERAPFRNLLEEWNSKDNRKWGFHTTENTIRMLMQPKKRKNQTKMKNHTFYECL